MKVYKVKGIDTKEKAIGTWNRGESPSNGDLMLIDLPGQVDKRRKWNKSTIEEQKNNTQEAMSVQRTPLGDCSNCLSIKGIAKGTEVRKMTKGQWKRKARMQG